MSEIDRHPLPELVAAGVPVTINSDDPPMFGTTLNDEYAVAAKLLKAGPSELAALARAAVNASFLPAPDKARLGAEIDAYPATDWDTTTSTN